MTDGWGVARHQPVLIGWSGSPTSRRAAAAAITELGPTCRYLLAHVEDGASPLAVEATTAAMERFARDQMADVEVVVAPGDPVETLCDVARARGAGLVVLGWDATHPRRRSHPVARAVADRCLSAVVLWPSDDVAPMNMS